jgi:hypothetical protein
MGADFLAGRGRVEPLQRAGVDLLQRLLSAVVVLRQRTGLRIAADSNDL